MKINSLRVSGELVLHYEFAQVNILLGENTTGKSTFIKLLLYALGVNINNFIEEIATKSLCNSVSIEIETKAGNKFVITRKLPISDMVTVIPMETNGNILLEDAIVLNMREYSDFLLEEESYQSEVISYSQGKTATLRYYFLLRACVVDQTTPHSKILSNLNIDKSEYISNQTLINNAIIEKILSRNTSEIQRLRLELKSIEKEKNELNSRIVFYKEAIDEKREQNPNLPINIEKIKKEIEMLDDEKKKLADEKYQILINYEKLADKSKENEIGFIKKELNKCKEERTTLNLQCIDAKETKEKLSNELELIKQRLAAHKIIHSIPVTICPICFSEISVDTLCEHCSEVDFQTNIDSMAGYKRMIEESIKEADLLIDDYTQNISDLNKKINKLEKQISTLEVEYFEKLTTLRNPLESLIREIQSRIESMITKHYTYSEIVKQLVMSDNLKGKRKELNDKLTDLRDELEIADQKTAKDVNIIQVWNKLFQELVNDIFGADIIAIISEDDYMPVMNNIPINKISSESEKLVAQLAYILSLFKLESYLEGDKINNIGFIMFDSPKDKDLDIDKYERFLSLLHKTSEGQIFLTGSITDELIYKKHFNDVKFMPTLSKQDKLLKNK